ncbi:hypothetical protein A5717_25945 [Mycolicibacterium porcinum]|uniref:hypothetical protein n=1 Tax=Mycolicibacterium porcinum TaxID=39693 RepID=UPI00080B9F51|nr:hypothetical protein [Mycolicibacterium porcinum]OCB09220.1 hypothetical protein A5717_25945 [Mycolicibacterium porcinum]
MPDLTEVDQIKQLADLMKTMPPQEGSTMRIPFGIEAKRVQWATELVRDFGVRVHPDLAKKEMTPAGPVSVGSAGNQRAIDKVDLGFLVTLLRGTEGVPGFAELADEIEAAGDDPAKKAELRERISRQYPDMVATAKKIVDETPPEAFEQ